MEVALTVLAAIGTTLSILKIYQAVLAVIGVFKTKKFKSTKIKKYYGICIAARNEEKVIRNLLESIYAQDYPQERLQIFVVADNCTDNTAAIVRELILSGHDNTTLYEHNNPNERTKGFALKYLFEQIKKDFGIECFAGYFIFDADNVLNKNYITKMNDAFVTDGKAKIFTSFRNSKNTSRNWISFQYAIHWMGTCLAENRAKSLMPLACRVQGTGILFTNELVREGWNYTSLTEDRFFGSDAVVKNYRISYCDEAEFFDEQPTNLKIAWRQRLRWSKGHLNSTAVNCPKLIRNMFRFDDSFFKSYDCFWLNFPTHIESLCRRLISLVLNIIIAAMAANLYGWFIGALATFGLNAAKFWLGGMAKAAFVVTYYRKRLSTPPRFFKTLFNVFMFPVFNLFSRWTMYVALFARVEWKPIPHDSLMNLDGGDRPQELLVDNKNKKGKK